MLLRARLLVPMNGPPIEDGAVRIAGDRVAEAGRWRDLRGDAIDLGEVALVPGLINAHSHLDYTSLAGRIPPPDSFNGWITSIMRLKNEMDDGTWRASWREGAAQCLKHGTTTLGNIETRSDLLPDLLAEVRLRLLLFLEVIVVRPATDAGQALAEAADFLKGNVPPLGAVGLSPHATYTVRPDALRECVRTAEENDWPLAMHLAESSDEDAMFREGSGALYQRLAAVERDMADCGGRSPVKLAAEHGALSKRTLAVHGNYLDDEDVRLLAESEVSVVHCPRSHEYFGHSEFRFEALRSAGVNVCLGTDSLATMPDGGAELDMFAEMREFCRRHTGIAPEDVVKMATVNGAAALGWQGAVGEISAGAFADLVALPLAGGDVFGEIMNCAEMPVGVMVGGEWVVLPASCRQVGC
ncbi:MAG: hypothetical protein CMO74_01755 [Verrucomicrobiales bacterium]|nr:hypothetical protein [Verrucomicrobiales bacterium]